MPDIVTADRLSPSFAPFINPYVINGYPLHVKGDTTLKLLFSLTNETLNIWSHLVASLVYLCILVKGLVGCDQAWCRAWDDFFIYLFVLLSFFVSMIFSAGFHCFCYISRPIRDRWLTKDIFGVVMGVTGLAISQTYYVLEGYGTLRLKYMLALAASSAYVIKNVLDPDSFLSAYKAHINSSKKTLTLLVWGLSSSIPVAHWWILEGISSHKVMSYTPRLLLVPVMAVIGVTVYMCRIPERFAPGRFDYVGFSHHIWHVIAFATQYFWLRTLNIMIEYKYKYLGVQ